MQKTLPHPYKVLFLFLLASLSAFGQQPREILSGITARPGVMAESASVSEKKVQKINLPINDDFSYARSSTFPRRTIWQDSNVYVNMTYGIDPITMGVATFDGLDKYGLPYEQGLITTDTADILTSLPIDMANTNGNVVLSFYYQSEGLGESPAFNDSLALYFYSPLTLKWYSVWRARGANTEDFKLVQIPITANRFLQDDFQFRFISYGSPGGAFDMWHIDRVVLDDERDTSDTGFFDLSFTSTPPSLLSDYRAIPWFHYNGPVPDLINTDQWNLSYRRNVQFPGQNFGLGLKVYKVLYNGTVLDERIPANADFGEDDTHLDNEVNSYTVDVGNFLLPSPPTGEFELTGINTYTGVSPLTRNDSLITRQVFKNYYAYDDGSAERIYRVTDNANGVILSRFSFRGTDSLKGLFLYFLPGTQNSTTNTFSIVVFENDGGVPGSLLYETDTLYTPQYSHYTNNYLAYAFKPDSGIVLSNTTYFLGIRQTNSTEMTLGFDKNNIRNNAIFYGQPGSLFPSFVEGTLMMRPFFKYLPDDIGQEELSLSEVDFEVYPNPNSEGIIYVNISGAEPNETFSYRLLTISGQPIGGGELNRSGIPASHLSIGIYLLQIESSDLSKKPAFQKVVISH